jgi:hypothetical protein
MRCLFPSHQAFCEAEEFADSERLSFSSHFCSVISSISLPFREEFEKNSLGVYGGSFSVGQLDVKKIHI